MSLSKTVSAAWIKTAKVGDSIVCYGHTAHAHTPLVRAKVKHSTKKAWLVLLETNQPMPVTIITLVE